MLRCSVVQCGKAWYTNCVVVCAPENINFEYAPCPGSHLVVYNGNTMLVERTRAEQALMDINTGQPFETVRLTAIGRSRRIFEELLRDASEDAFARERHHTVIYKVLLLGCAVRCGDVRCAC